ncbi:hypothetical protein AAMO2058_000078700 [Amorphochlora amoebiformis]
MASGGRDTLDDLLRSFKSYVEKIESKSKGPTAAEMKTLGKNILKIREMIHSLQTATKEEKTGSFAKLCKADFFKSALYWVPALSADSNNALGHVWCMGLTLEPFATDMDDYLRENPEIIVKLVQGYETEKNALVFGQILKQAVKHAPVSYLITQSPLIWKFFEYVGDTGSYVVKQDAFATFKTMFTRSNKINKKIMARFLSANFEKFFLEFNRLLTAKQYVVKRQSLKLLSEILQERQNFKIMIRYISDPKHLDLVVGNMTTQDPKQKGIRFEAFHVFKFFVANPNKPEGIIANLRTNKADLLATLSHMQRDNTEYGKELPMLIQKVQSI